MHDQVPVIMTALIMLALIICWALYLGYDGALLTSVIAIFGYVIGYKHKATRPPVNS